MTLEITIPVTGKEPAKGFDYATLNSGAAEFARTKAAEIWERHERMIGDWIATAEAFEEVAAKFANGRGGKRGNQNTPKDQLFSEWVKTETPYSPDVVARMRKGASKLRTLARSHVRIHHTTADRLFRGDPHPEAVEAVLDRIESGEKVSHREAQQINRVARDMDGEAPLFSPKKANQVARETGQPQIASDGRLYLGLSAEEVAHGKAQNKLDFGIIDGVAFFSSIEISPEEWLNPENSALMEWPVTDPPKIKEAVDWLKGLAKAWDAYAKTQAVNGEHHEDAE